MNADLFYESIVRIFELPPQERHQQLITLHSQVKNEYVAAIQRITAAAAERPVAVDGDQRTLAQVVAHITEWERFGILAAGDVLAGVQHPRTVTDVKGFVETDGRRIDFADVHEFNRHQAEKYSTWSWPQLQKQAIDTAEIFYELFAHPQLLTAERLEHTKPHRKRLANGQVIDNTTMGWCLWVIYLDHEAVEHAEELGLP